MNHIFENGKLTLTGYWRGSEFEGIDAHRVTHLVLNYALGWRGDTLDFLAEFTSLETLEILDYRLKNLNPIHQLRTLRALTLSESSKTIIDFSTFRDLEALELADWSEERYSSVFSCTSLKSLGIYDYSDPSLAAFGKLRKLERLGVNGSPVESLKCAPEMNALLRLSLLHVKKLRSLVGIEALSNLLVLWVEEAPLLRRLDGIERLSRLRTLILTDCPAIESLDPLSKTPSLEGIHMGGRTNVNDGNLSALRRISGLKHASFVNRRHYSETSDSFPKLATLFY